MLSNIKHIPALPKEVIKYLRPKKEGIYIDATLGGGGHSAIIASYLGKDGKIFGIDQDKEAIKRAKIKLAKYGNKISYIHDNFKNLDKIILKFGIKKVDGILFDLGVSTEQLENPERGFSFSENLNAPLDMRMDPSQKLTAYDIVNKYPEEKIREILYKLGEEPYAKKIARRIVSKRKIKPIKTTGDLLEIIRQSTPPKYRFSRRGHWASKVFRALRMEVNQELPALEEVIPKAVSCLKTGGRLVVISFHSLEDRIVKRTFKEMSRLKLVKLLTKKPVMASQEEIEKNPKADSAKLRAVEKIDNS
jgi:16S rRNA (cytosine1402-N4)-methyltransferase